MFVTDFLLHLRDPQLALERAYSVCRGMIVVAEPYDPYLDAFSDQPLTRFVGTTPSVTWWMPNTSTLRATMDVAGFELVNELARFTLDAAVSAPIYKVVLHSFASERQAWRGRVEEKHLRRRRATSPSMPTPSDPVTRGSNK